MGEGTPMPNDVIYAFYRGERTDSAGRYLHEVWAMDHDELEFHHDFIQWLFPLDKRAALMKHSVLFLNKQLEGFEHWNEASIADRGQALCEVAEAIWPCPTKA